MKNLSVLAATPVALFCGLLGVSSPSLGAGEALVIDKYELIIYQDSPGESEIIAGKLDRAIETIRTTNTLDSAYDTHTNLCVAYTVQKQFDLAHRYCKAAVRESNSGSSSIQLGYRVPSADKERRAAALSNLGVMHALQGNGSTALRYFEAAARKSSRLAETADRNMDALAQDQDSKVAAAS